MPDPVRVRFAPSPTGYLHVGGARTALFNYLYARKTGGVFVLRIEDTDRERSTDESTRTILDGMTWLGLAWDEGPVHQADGLARHRADAGRLLAEGKAYRCFCTPEALAAKREALKNEYRYDRSCYAISPAESDRRAAAGEPFTVRFRVPEGTTAWDDVVHGVTTFDNASIEDFIILRTAGTPIYNLAVVSDDVDMRITHVVRGDDHIANTPKQILLYQALGAPVPTFAHLPMILGPDGKKLSKRHGATAVGDYAGMGILPEALFNFLALLGWNPGDEREVMGPAELVEAFSLERINKKAAVFDTEKLLWMNGQYLARKSAQELLPLVGPELVAEGLVSPADVEAPPPWLLALVDLLKVRARSTLEIAPQARALLGETVAYDESAVAKQWRDPATAERLLAVREALAVVEPWTPEAIEPVLRDVAERLGVGLGKVAQPLRVALTGSAASPGIDQVLWLMGRQKALGRIDAAVALIASSGAAQENR
ncbi:MAG TPA: glutamate--tRNA ligase [Longimicrobium sp.]|jgi:glutamyl-tRNA synthetase|nr:glutamate--tRNA ligase [Longimicrobium sp.]